MNPKKSVRNGVQLCLDTGALKSTNHCQYCIDVYILEHFFVCIKNTKIHIQVRYVTCGIFFRPLPLWCSRVNNARKNSWLVVTLRQTRNSGSPYSQKKSFDLQLTVGRWDPRIQGTLNLNSMNSLCKEFVWTSTWPVIQNCLGVFGVWNEVTLQRGNFFSGQSLFGDHSARRIV